MRRQGVTMFKPRFLRVPEPAPSPELQQSFVLARLRSNGPAFDHELIAECQTPDPGAVVAALNAQGHHIEALRCFRWLPDGSQGWAALFVMRVKCEQTGAVIPAPVPVGFGPVRERWNP